MDIITKLTLGVLTIYFTSLAYGEPCYTDIGTCDKNEQIVIVKSKETKTGTGFCTKALYDENKTKCYYDPPQLATAKKERKKKEKGRKAPNSNMNLVYTASSVPVKYEYVNNDENNTYDNYELYRPNHQLPERSYNQVVTVINDPSESSSSSSEPKSIQNNYYYNRYRDDDTYFVPNNNWNNNYNNGVLDTGKVQAGSKVVK